MRSFDLFDSWKHDGSMNGILNCTEIIDEHSFCFPNVQLISLSNETDKFFIVFKTKDKKARLCINKPSSIAWSSNCNQKIDLPESYLEVYDVGGKLRFIISNHISGLFISMFAVDAVLELL